jgi:hypothetical protein
VKREPAGVDAGDGCRAWSPPEAHVTDWAKILKEQRKEGERMRREVPKMLADPGILRDQVMTLFSALEKQSAFVETLVRVLEETGYEPDIVKAAERLEELYVELAETAAEKARGMAT